MTAVHLLWHVRSDDESKLIGVYSTPTAALEAIERVKDQPGFADHPGGFQTDKYEIDADHWTEGFVTC